MRSMTSNITRLGQDMTRSVTLPIIGVGAAALKSAADLQTLETSFISLTGGTEQAAKMMQQLNAFTAKTPFQIDAVAKSARQLIASGTDVSQVNEQLQFLGDIAAGSGNNIDEIAAIFAKVNAKGKVELESLNQLAERGIGVFAALSEATGLPADKLGAGAVSVEQFNDVLRGLTEEGGLFEGSMLRLSNTVSGKFSTALDTAKFAAASLGKELLPFASKALDAFTNLAQKFTELDDSTKQIGIAIAGVTASFGPLLVILPKIVQGLTLLTSPISASVLAIGALVAAFVYFYDDVRPIITQVANLMIMLYNKIVPIRIVVAFVQTAFTNLGKAIATAFRAALDIISTLVKSLSQLISGDFSGAFDTITTGLKNVAVDVVTTGAEIGTELINAVNEAIYAEEIDLLGEDALPTRAEIMDRFSSLFSGAGAVVEESLAPATQTVTDLFKKLEAVTVDVSANVTDNVEKMSDGMQSLLRGFTDGIDTALNSTMTFGQGVLEVVKSVIKGYLAAAKAKVVQNAIEGASGTGPAFPFVAAGLLTAGMALVDRVGMPALANGGLAFGPTTALVGDNRNARIDPEVIAPLSKLKDMMGGNVVEVVGRIKGDDIFLSNARNTINRNRYS
jgi:tape measure domain-containing protein